MYISVTLDEHDMKNKKKSIRIEFYEKDKIKLVKEAKRRNIPLKNMLENECVKMVESLR